ncbi:MAG: hypothetical protein IPJ61_03930 [Tessaracoccus sp.]|nr:hypothetical protein [Tessaracoccus sp.]MBK7820229.1 hypothetical protein [Tessaracoccus sp.]
MGPVLLILGGNQRWNMALSTRKTPIRRGEAAGSITGWSMSRSVFMTTR